MKTEVSLLLIVCLSSLIYLFGTAFSESHGSKAQAQSGPLDVTLQSCAEFAGDESHLDAAYHVVTKGYKSIPGQKQPVAQIEGVENPEKVKEFMDWYANGGRTEMNVVGSMCSIETMTKSGETAQLRAGIFIAEERARTAEFFADKLLKQYTGKNLM
jgi:hypothetical protein